MAASQVVATVGDLAVVEFESYVRGYHAYMQVWSPVVGQSLCVKREPTNILDGHAVAVCNESQVVGHIPYNLAPTISAFLRRDVNKAFAEVTGARVNRGAGYGLEIPCIYRLYGPKSYVERMRVICEEWRAIGYIQ